MILVHRAVLQQERSTLRRTVRAQSIAVHHESQHFSNTSRRRSSSETIQNEPTASSANRFRNNVLRSDRPSTRLARRLARQSYLYVGALYITYIPVIVTRSFELANGYVHYEMLLTISITIPLQGLWNVLVYLRPRYLAKRDARKKRKEMDRIRAEARREREQRKASGEVSSGTLSAHAPPSSSGKGSTGFLAFRWDILQDVSQVVQEGGLENEEQEDENDVGVKEVDEQSDGSDPSSRDDVKDEILETSVPPEQAKTVPTTSSADLSNV